MSKLPYGSIDKVVREALKRNERNSLFERVNREEGEAQSELNSINLIRINQFQIFEHLHELPFLVHRGHDIAPSNKLTIDKQLWDGGPVSAVEFN
jgi:hypothetical protein